MHFVFPVIVTALLIAPAQAQTPPPPPSTQAAPSAAASPPAAAAPASAQAPAATRPAYRRLTLLQRYDEANTPKDGHLTLDQANAVHWTYISRNFDAMDKAHKGYVTVDDIRTFARERRAARQTQPGGTRAHG